MATLEILELLKNMQILGYIITAILLLGIIAIICDLHEIKQKLKEYPEEECNSDGSPKN